jgi:voltage-gated potassium channel Kch
MAFQVFKSGQFVRRWYPTLGLGALTIGFGYWGYVIAEPDSTVLEHIRQVFVLFLPWNVLIEVPEGDWPLQVGRILGTLTFITVVVQALIEGIYLQWDLTSLKRKRGHIIILGFGRCGQQLCLDFLRDGETVIAVEPEPTEQQQEFCRRNRGVTLVTGDASDPNTLKQVAIHRAERAVFISARDTSNLEGATQMRSFIQQQGRRRRRRLGHRPEQFAHVQILDAKLIASIKDYPHFVREDIENQFKVATFNFYALAARQFLLRYPIYRYADMRGQERVHVVIVGFEEMGQHIALQVAVNAHYRDFEQPAITVLDPQAARRRDEFLCRYPGMNKPEVCELRFIHFDSQVQRFDEPRDDWHDVCAAGIQPADDRPASLLRCLDQLYPSAYGSSVSAFVIGFPDEQENVGIALQLRTATQTVRYGLAPIFLHMTQDDLPDILPGVAATQSFQSVMQSFGMAREICTRAEVVDASSDALAQFLHEDYREHHPEANAEPWETLDETYREATRAAADHLPVKLSSIGCIVPGLPSQWAPAIDLRLHKDYLARLEHQRWRAERRVSGWQFGDRLDLQRKLDPELDAVEHVPERTRARRREHIEALQRSFGDKGGLSAFLTGLKGRLFGEQVADALRVRRELWLGVAATCPLEEQQSTWLRGILGEESALGRVINQYSDHFVSLISPLSCHAEMLFAETGLELAAQWGRGSISRLLVPEALPYHLIARELSRQINELEQANVRDEHHYRLTQLLKLCEQHKRQAEVAEWTINLQPSGETAATLLPPASTNVAAWQTVEARQEDQIQRAHAYVIERCDIVVLIGRPEACAHLKRWRADPRAIPARLSSLPPSLRARRLPHRLGIYLDPFARQGPMPLTS